VQESRFPFLEEHVMHRNIGSRHQWVATLAVLALGACTSSEPSRTGVAGMTGAAGAAGATATAGTTGTAGSTGGGGTTEPAGTTGMAGSTGTAGSAGGTTGGNGGAGGATGGSGGAAAGATGTLDAGSGGATISDAGANSDGSFTLPPGVAGRTLPTCATPKPSPVPSKKPTNECDYLLQSVDFEDMWSYATPADSIRITNFGTALGYFEINKCSPYCFSKALTIGVDIVGGGDAKALQGEVIVKFPAMGPGLPIMTAVGRDSLAWIQLDGPTAPPFKIMAQLVVENSTGVIPGVESREVGYADWLGYQKAEFKYFSVTDKTFSAPPVNVTGIGFRIMAPANLPKGMEWHGVLIIDHLQLRTGAAPKDPPGAYPFGL
jgi:hypothetical protein